MTYLLSCAKLVSFDGGSGCRATPMMVHLENLYLKYTLCRGYPALQESGKGEQLIGLRSERHTSISRRHVSFAYRKGNWVICDEKSSHNGVFVNRHRLTPEKWYILESGDRIDLCDPDNATSAASYLFIEPTEKEKEDFNAMVTMLEPEELAAKISSKIIHHTDDCFERIKQILTKDNTGGVKHQEFSVQYDHMAEHRKENESSLCNVPHSSGEIESNERASSMQRDMVLVVDTEEIKSDGNDNKRKACEDKTQNETSQTEKRAEKRQHTNESDIPEVTPGANQAAFCTSESISPEQHANNTNNSTNISVNISEDSSMSELHAVSQSYSVAEKQLKNSKGVEMVPTDLGVSQNEKQLSDFEDNALNVKFDSSSSLNLLDPLAVTPEKKSSHGTESTSDSCDSVSESVGEIDEETPKALQFEQIMNTENNVMKQNNPFEGLENKVKQNVPDTTETEPKVTSESSEPPEGNSHHDESSSEWSKLDEDPDQTSQVDLQIKNDDQEQEECANVGWGVGASKLSKILKNLATATKAS